MDTNPPIITGSCDTTAETKASACFGDLIRDGTECGLEEDEVANERRWNKLVRHGVARVIRKHPASFRRHVLDGIPASHRWHVWKAAVGLDRRMQEGQGRFEALLAKDTQWKRLIRVDVPRTFPDDARFDESRRNSLHRILHAYSVFDRDVGYCQGMSFVVGLLLLVSGGSNDEEVFWMFVAFMRDYHLAGFYAEGFPLFRRYLDALTALMDVASPELAEHFRQEHVQPSDFAHLWYLTVFINCLPMPATLCVWDSIFCGEGLPVLLSVTVTVLNSLKHVLLSQPFENILSFMKTIQCKQTVPRAERLGRLLMRRSASLVIPDLVLRMIETPEDPASPT
eukprot:TRINITY_DN40656_c0_g1_i1.p1 TRINITY_DN40656_c0_g1~~TRINITY_DN40656_c0_g1_i1.p1  ORF type:complete len:339 (-),score=48.80 TRINITY_DN40656_c0_g1_i1:103-1119(-)